jgi:hypothetical protein
MLFAKDKMLHIGAGFLITIVFVVVFHNPGFGLMAAIAAGLAKEYIWDAGINYLNKRKGLPPAHDVDFEDAIATIIGGLAGTLLTSLILHLAFT